MLKRGRKKKKSDTKRKTYRGRERKNYNYREMQKKDTHEEREEVKKRRVRQTDRRTGRESGRRGETKWECERGEKGEREGRQTVMTVIKVQVNNLPIPILPADWRNEEKKMVFMQRTYLISSFLRLTFKCLSLIYMSEESSAKTQATVTVAVLTLAR